MNYIERIKVLQQDNNLRSVEYIKCDNVLQVRTHDIEFFNYHNINDSIISELAKLFGRPAFDNKWNF